MKRQAATAIPGGVTSGDLERGESKQSVPSPSAETDPPSRPVRSPLPPSVDPRKDAALKEVTTATTVVAEEDASSIESKTVGEAETTAAAVGQDAEASVKPKAKEVSRVPSAVVGTDSNISAAGEAAAPVVAVERKTTASAEKKKAKDGVGPETTAAEKV